MSTIRDQLLSKEWAAWKKYYLEQNDSASCESCGTTEKLDLYIRHFHAEFLDLREYPASSFGIHCHDCKVIKMQRIDEIKNRIGCWSVEEADSLLDALDNVDAFNGHRSNALGHLYGYSKQLK